MMIDTKVNCTKPHKKLVCLYRIYKFHCDMVSELRWKMKKAWIEEDYLAFNELMDRKLNHEDARAAFGGAMDIQR